MIYALIAAGWFLASCGTFRLMFLTLADGDAESLWDDGAYGDSMPTGVWFVFGALLWPVTMAIYLLSRVYKVLTLPPREKRRELKSRDDLR